MSVRIITGDCRTELAKLPDQSVHCCVTSPPYFGLRDYGTAKWSGGDANCDHRRFNGYTSGLDGGKEAQDIGKLFKDVCGKCGARRIDNQIGLEATPDAFVAEMVAVFREVRRVLRDDGTLWLNLGDSYAGSGKGGNPEGSKWSGFVGNKDREKAAQPAGKQLWGMKAKDLIGIPWRVAFALQADGWYLRQDIIWSKPNPMPESVTDRCTKAHEYIFLMSKSARYFYDSESIAEETVCDREGKVTGRGTTGWTQARGNERSTSGGFGYQETRNKRSVWSVSTQPFSEAHFATFPPDLIEPCIKAGCPKGGTVLDPFGGAGTTGLVADRLGRNAILIELNPEYAALAERRLFNDSPLFMEAAQ